MTLQDTVKELCKKKGVSVNRFEQEAGLAKGYVSKLAKTQPNTATIKKMADYFGVSAAYLMNGEEVDGTVYLTPFTQQELNEAIMKAFKNQYYEDAATAELAQSMKDNRELRVLFDAAKDATPEDLRTVSDMLMLFKKRRENEN